VAILQVRIVEGEGAVHRAGSRSSRPLTVQVTDETGKPVAGAAVSFRLPEEDPTGSFTGGLRSDVQITGPDGLASVWGIQWARIPGTVRVRITTAKGEARAGTICSVQLADITTEAPGAAPAGVRAGTRRWWLAAAGIAGGAVAGGLAARLGRPSRATTPPSTPAVQIGPPSISVGRP